MARFLTLIVTILLVLIAGIIIFILEYRRRVVSNEREKIMSDVKHKEELLNEKEEMQQKTMANIGREIHDSVAQKLTLAALYVQQLDYENKYPAITERLITISEIINEAINELRSLSKKLTNDPFEQKDLVELLEHECDSVNAIGLCTVHFNSDSKHITTSADVKRVLVRIIQEFLQNSLKHAASTTINVTLISNSKGLAITASDNGKGFNPAQISGEGIGITSMAKRAVLIGASLSINSKPGAGTHIRVFIPTEKFNAAL